LLKTVKKYRPAKFVYCIALDEVTCSHSHRYDNVIQGELFPNWAKETASRKLEKKEGKEKLHCYHLFLWGVGGWGYHLRSVKLLVSKQGCVVQRFRFNKRF